MTHRFIWNCLCVFLVLSWLRKSYDSGQDKSVTAHLLEKNNLSFQQKMENIILTDYWRNNGSYMLGLWNVITLKDIRQLWWETVAPYWDGLSQSKKMKCRDEKAFFFHYLGIDRFVRKKGSQSSLMFAPDWSRFPACSSSFQQPITWVKSCCFHSLTQKLGGSDFYFYDFVHLGVKKPLFSSVLFYFEFLVWWDLVSFFLQFDQLWSDFWKMSAFVFQLKISRQNLCFTRLINMIM